jgi:hypothetical protein
MTLYRDHISGKLTRPDPALDAAARVTFPGQAHFACTGPQGRTCRECLNWQHGAWDYHSKIGKHHGLIKPATCAKYQMITQKVGAKIPDDAGACKYFEFNKETPKRYA